MSSWHSTGGQERELILVISFRAFDKETRKDVKPEDKAWASDAQRLDWHSLSNDIEDPGHGVVCYWYDDMMPLRTCSRV